MKLILFVRNPASLVGVRAWLGLLLFLSGLIPSFGSEARAGRRVLFDDYYQKARPDELFGQGVARGGPELRSQTNFYSPDATAIPNGTFAFSQAIADQFQVEISRQPLSEELLRGVTAYLLVSPMQAKGGGRADLTEREAAILQDYVARGGSLVLVANSIPDPEKSDMDFAGLNLIARRFGVRFLATQTDTISIPVASDHPVFDGVSAIIYGNGNTLEILPEAEPTTQVLLTSHSPRAPGPAAVLATYRKGRVLLIGDAGTFGNAHVFRSDIGQKRGLQQMMAALLPDGAAPRYGWKEGVKLRVKVKQEQILSGYPELMRVFSLPRPPGTTVVTSAMRALDLEASGAQAGAAGSRDFVSAISERAGEFILAIGASDGRAHLATWAGPAGKLSARLLPAGRQLDPGVPAGEELLAWQGILLNEVICAPLKAYANPGDKWESGGLVSLPQFRLTMSPRWVEAPAQYTFEGESSYEGKPCYVFKRVIQLDGKGWSPSDLVGPEYAMQFNAGTVEVLAAGELVVAKYWISKDSLLPRHSEVKVTSVLWWQDPRFPAKYIGTHDSKNYENWATINFNLTYGRVLTADFDEL